MKIAVVVLLLLVVVGVMGVEKCSKPSPAAGFTFEGYEGFWYEVGKIQTKGGAFFERECVCTTINIRFAFFSSLFFFSFFDSNLISFIAAILIHNMMESPSNNAATTHKMGLY